jgi:hypothetical protein
VVLADWMGGEARRQKAEGRRQKGRLESAVVWPDLLGVVHTSSAMCGGLFSRARTDSALGARGPEIPARLGQAKGGFPALGLDANGFHALLADIEAE